MSTKSGSHNDPAFRAASTIRVDRSIILARTACKTGRSGVCVANRQPVRHQAIAGPCVKMELAEVSCTNDSPLKLLHAITPSGATWVHCANPTSSLTDGPRACRRCGRNTCPSNSFAKRHAVSRCPAARSCFFVLWFRFVDELRIDQTLKSPTKNNVKNISTSAYFHRRRRKSLSARRSGFMNTPCNNRE